MLLARHPPSLISYSPSLSQEVEKEGRLEDKGEGEQKTLTQGQHLPLSSADTMEILLLSILRDQ